VPLHDTANTSQIPSQHNNDAFLTDLTTLLRHQCGADFAALSAIWPTLHNNIRSAILALAAITVNQSR
jgi:hypothetical protein